jgi:hypothetical protein
MRKLAQFIKPSRRPLIILAAIVLLLALICVGGWWLTAFKATEDYHTQNKAYLDNTKKSLTIAQSQLKDLAARNDALKTIEALASLQDTLKKQAVNLPKVPDLFGISLAPKEDQDKRAMLIQRLKQLEQNVESAHDLLVYEHAVATVLQDVTTKTGANADQQKVLAAAWQEMANKLKALTPPDEAKSMHTQLVDAVVATQASLAALPDLFNKKDVSGFGAKQKEAQGHVDAIRDIGKTIVSLAITKDQQIARSYRNIQDILK